jgi:CRP/FNR family transcriptional regulator
MNATQLLGQASFFDGLPALHAGALAAIAVPRTLRKRQTLFLEGQKGHSIFLLAGGAIRLFKTDEDGRAVTVRIVEPGELFAEAVLFEEDRYPVGAEALSASTVYAIRRGDFLRLLNDEKFRNDFIAGLMRKLRYLTRRLMHLAAYDVERRFLAFLFDHYGMKTEYRINLSKRDVAAAIETHPETLSRLLRKLRKKGWASWRGKVLRLDRRAWAALEGDAPGGQYDRPADRTGKGQDEA